MDYKGTRNQREALAAEIAAKRDALEAQHEGNYRKIYPAKGYDKFFDAASQLWQW